MNSPLHDEATSIPSTPLSSLSPTPRPSKRSKSFSRTSRIIVLPHVLQVAETRIMAHTPTLLNYADSLLDPSDIRSPQRESASQTTPPPRLARRWVSRRKFFHMWEGSPRPAFIQRLAIQADLTRLGTTRANTLVKARPDLKGSLTPVWRQLRPKDLLRNEWEERVAKQEEMRTVLNSRRVEVSRRNMWKKKVW